MHAAFDLWTLGEIEEDETPTPSGIVLRHARHDDAPDIEVCELSRREASELALLELAQSDSEQEDDAPTREYLAPHLCAGDFGPQLIDAWIALELDSRAARRRRFGDELLDSWLR